MSRKKTTRKEVSSSAVDVSSAAVDTTNSSIFEPVEKEQVTPVSSDGILFSSEFDSKIQEENLEPKSDAIVEGLESETPLKEVPLPTTLGTLKKLEEEDDMSKKKSVEEAIATLKEPALTAEVVQLNMLLAAYKRAIENQPKYGSADTRATALNAFTKICTYVLGNATNDVLERLYQFFIIERNGLMADTVVFQGARILERAERMRLETFFTVWKGLIECKLGLGPFVACNAAIEQYLACPNIIAFVTRKLKQDTL